MKLLSMNDIQQVSGGKCAETYEIKVPLIFLGMVMEGIDKIKKGGDPSGLIKSLVDAGIDPKNVDVKVSITCG